MDDFLRCLFSCSTYSSSCSTRFVETPTIYFLEQLHYINYICCAKIIITWYDKNHYVYLNHFKVTIPHKGLKYKEKCYWKTSKEKEFESVRVERKCQKVEWLPNLRIMKEKKEYWMNILYWILSLFVFLVFF